MSGAAPIDESEPFGEHDAAASDRLLSIYLNDHLSGATFGRELVRYLVDRHGGTSFESPLTDLRTQIDEDVDALRSTMQSLGAGIRPWKPAVGWFGEKVMRLKPNGDLKYSALDRVAQLEILSLGIEGKCSLWRALRDLAPSRPELSAERLDELIHRAEQQRATSEELRRRAVHLAFHA
jgi:hypothetical protein